MNSLTVNLHLLLTSFYRPTAERYKILIERNAFPSDRYAVQSQIRRHGFDPIEALVEIAPRVDEFALRHEDICERIDREGANIATILLPGVQYLTGQRFDIGNIADVAHKKRCAIGFDLAHAIGNVPLSLHDSNVDFAVWCSYKYLNGGPGAVGGAFVHERHARQFDLPRLTGWWGHDDATRFSMPDTFSPLSGAEGWQLSNPPILSSAPLIASLDVFARADMKRLRAKSVALTAFIEHELRERLGDKINIITPRNAESRGSQLSMLFNTERQAIDRIREGLVRAGIVCDWREPDVLRVAPAPLYNNFQDAWTLVDTLEGILA